MSNETLNRVRPRWTSPLTKAELEGLTSDGPLVCDWIEANCLYGEGDWYGEPVHLEGFQRDFINRLYLRDATGRRRYRRALLGMAKGNGKSPIAAWIGAYELCGGHNRSPRVIIGAASLKQANLVFGDLKTAIVGSVEHPGPLKPYVEPYDLRVLLKGQPGVAERIAAEAGTNDGARATAFIADELHEWVGGAGRVFMVVSGAIAKRRDGFLLAITTAGVMGTDAPLEALYDHGKRVAKGEVDDPSFLFVWYEPEDADVDVAEPEAWERAVRSANPAADVFLDVESVRHRFETMPSFEWRRYHLNQWTSAYNPWLPMEDWDACGELPEIPEGAEVFVGIDGAAKRDTTAVYVVHRDEDGVLHTAGRVFEPPPGDEEIIDPVLVENHIREVAKTYEVRAFLYDPALFFRSAVALQEEGYPMEEVPQTVPRKMQFAQALYDVVSQQRLRHGGDPILRAHAEAVVAKDRGNGWTMEKLKSTHHIDACIALGMAVQAAEDDSGGGFLWMDEEVPAPTLPD